MILFLLINCLFSLHEVAKTNATKINNVIKSGEELLANKENLLDTPETLGLGDVGPEVAKNTIKKNIIKYKKINILRKQKQVIKK